MLLMNLIFAELIMALYGVPVNFLASLQKGWKMGKLMCETFGFSLTLGSKLKAVAVMYSFKFANLECQHYC